MSLLDSQMRWLIVSLAIIALDLVTKAFAVQYLPYGTPVKIFSFFNLTLVYNYGAAFSFLNNAATFWQVILLSSVTLVIMVLIFFWLLKLSRNKNGLALALCLILGGAAGNLYDRIVHGYVVDFLDFHIQNYHWPAFNIADSAICIGVVLIVFFNFSSPREKVKR